MTGYLDVLSVGRGHLRLTFDGNDEADRERAEQTISDMLKRGYAIFIEDDDGTVKRVRSFDPEAFVYIVDDDDAMDRTRTCRTCGADKPLTWFPLRGRGRSRDCSTCLGATKRSKRPTKRVEVSRARATAVGRSAGG